MYDLVQVTRYIYSDQNVLQLNLSFLYIQQEDNAYHTKCIWGMCPLLGFCSVCTLTFICAHAQGITDMSLNSAPPHDLKHDYRLRPQTYALRLIHTWRDICTTHQRHDRKIVTRSHITTRQRHDTTTDDAVLQKVFLIGIALGIVYHLVHW
jgi:hypothetical protein